MSRLQFAPSYEAVVSRPSFEVRSWNTRRVQRSVRAIPQPTFLRQSFGVSCSFKTTLESSCHFSRSHLSKSRHPGPVAFDPLPTKSRRLKKSNQPTNRRVDVWTRVQYSHEHGFIPDSSVCWGNPSTIDEIPLPCQEIPLDNIKETPLSNIEETPLL